MPGRTVHATQTIVAGCGFADLLMRVMLIRDLDHLVQQHPYAFFGVVADDVQFNVLGTLRFVLDRAPRAATDLIRSLQAAGLPVSCDPKNLFLPTSDPELAKEVVSHTPELSQASLPRAARNLGIDYVVRPSRGAVQGVRKARMKVTAKRAKRIREFRRAGGRIQPMLRPALGSTAMYGVGVTGFSTQHIREWKQHYHMALGTRTH
eukprot:7939775-Pyramimonas_sp.AAC.1